MIVTPSLKIAIHYFLSIPLSIISHYFTFIFVSYLNKLNNNNITYKNAVSEVEELDSMNQGATNESEEG